MKNRNSRMTVQALLTVAALSLPLGSVMEPAVAGSPPKEGSAEVKASHEQNTKAHTKGKGQGQSPANKRTMKETPPHEGTPVGKRQGQSPANKSTSIDDHGGDATAADKGEGQSPANQ